MVEKIGLGWLKRWNYGGLNDKVKVVKKMRLA